MGSQGAMVVVVGPSGVGKDSLIDFARTRLAGDHNIRFVRRTITRPAESGGESHDAVSEEEFADLEQRGGFAVSWQAHGLRYGIPAAVKGFVEAGCIVVANGSRRALPHFAATFAKLTVISITAKREVLAERLRLRGRENEKDISMRLARNEENGESWNDVVSIDNSGQLHVAGYQLVAVIKTAGAETSRANSFGQKQSAETSFARFSSCSWPFL